MINIRNVLFMRGRGNGQLSAGARQGVCGKDLSAGLQQRPLQIQPGRHRGKARKINRLDEVRLDAQTVALGQVPVLL